jgi:MerR family transcriptional regulator, thiopeptide resistance regulator
VRLYGRSAMTLDTPLLSVGEVSAKTGLTVRTLHHYDELGLLTPQERTHAGHRRYGPGDVERLYRIVALRRLGLSLDEVAAALDGTTLETVVRDQIAALDERIEASRRLRTLLAGVLDTLARSERPGVDDVLQAIEVTERMEKYYTPEQREYLARRKEELGDEAIREGERAWAEVLDGLRAEMEAGTDPADERLDAARARMGELLQAFHGGDPGIQRSLHRMWSEEDPAELSRGMMDRELTDYMGAVMRAGS